MENAGVAAEFLERRRLLAIILLSAAPQAMHKAVRVMLETVARDRVRGTRCACKCHVRAPRSICRCSRDVSVSQCSDALLDRPFWAPVYAARAGNGVGR